MHSLKSALGKQSEGDEFSVSVGNPSKTFSKSKNGSMWTLDPEEDEEDQKVKDLNAKLIKDFELIIFTAYKKESTFSEIVFFEIIEQAQTLSQELEELTRLQLIEKAALKINETSEQSLKGFLAAFLEFLIRRIKKLKKKEKKIELQQFDKIVKTNFKKKSGAQFIDEANFDNKETASKPFRNTAINDRSNGNKSNGKNSTSKRNGSASSNEGKLVKLISTGSLKDDNKQEENEEARTQQEESVSFSTVVSQSMVVRQRKPKDQKRMKKQKEEAPQKLQEKQSEGNDEAFIFYRPKAGKKK